MPTIKIDTQDMYLAYAAATNQREAYELFHAPGVQGGTIRETANTKIAKLAGIVKKHPDNFNLPDGADVIGLAYILESDRKCDRNKSHFLVRYTLCDGY